MFNFEKECSDPYDLQFMNTSIGAETLIWNFGDPTTMNDTSSMEMTSYTFPDTGSYLITLETYNSVTGCADTTELAYYITEPKVEFSFDTTQGCAPLTLLVENNSVFGDTYFWTSGSATFSDPLSPNPEVVFGTPGIYDDIQLIITDVNGCEDTLIFACLLYTSPSPRD